MTSQFYFWTKVSLENESVTSHVLPFSSYEGFVFYENQNALIYNTIQAQDY